MYKFNANEYKILSYNSAVCISATLSAVRRIRTEGEVFRHYVFYAYPAISTCSRVCMDKA